MSGQLSFADHVVSGSGSRRKDQLAEIDGLSGWDEIAALLRPPRRGRSAVRPIHRSRCSRRCCCSAGMVSRTRRSRTRCATGFRSGASSVSAPVAAQRLRARSPLFAFPRPPTAHAGRTHPEAPRSLAVTGTRRNRRQNPDPKVDRQGFRHIRRPPSGRQSESADSRFGIPSRFRQIGSCTNSAQALHIPSISGR